MVAPWWHRRGMPLGCRVLGLARSTFFDTAMKPPSGRAAEDARLTLPLLSIDAHGRGI